MLFAGKQTGSMAGFYLAKLCNWRSRLYLRKAEVVDVPAPGRCSLLLPETGETVADVHEVRPRLQYALL